MTILDTPTNLKQQLQQLQAQANRALEQVLPNEDIEPVNLHKAMRYAVINGGKRIRPLLVYATGLALNVPLEKLDAPACAVELIHAYSLIHDDLPAMDDDDLRRGQATCHIAFDEATAILAGDALQSLAFELLCQATRAELTATTCMQMLYTLAVASGSQGMAGGQAIDLNATNRQLDLKQLEKMHKLKTGALIEACIKLAYLCAEDLQHEQQLKLDQYARDIGLAFQIQDDILDITSDTETLGKTQGADISLNKSTFPNLMGLENSIQKASELHHKALQALITFGEPGQLLRHLTTYIVKRDC